MISTAVGIWGVSPLGLLQTMPSERPCTCSQKAGTLSLEGAACLYLRFVFSKKISQERKRGEETSTGAFVEPLHYCAGLHVSSKGAQHHV